MGATLGRVDVVVEDEVIVVAGEGVMVVVGWGEGVVVGAIDPATVVSGDTVVEARMGGGVVFGAS